MRHQIIRYLDALFIGMILGMLFITIFHASPAWTDAALSARILSR